MPEASAGSFRAAFTSPARFRKEVFGGLAVALALIPEVLSFSILAGLDPKVGLFASVIMALSIALTGGRPAMISAAAGSVAVVIAPLAHEHGLQYVLLTIWMAGIMQVVMGAVGVAKLMRFIPRSVMTGFVNALASSCLPRSCRTCATCPGWCTRWWRWAWPSWCCGHG